MNPLNLYDLAEGDPDQIGQWVRLIGVDQGLCDIDGNLTSEGLNQAELLFPLKKQEGQQPSNPEKR